MSFHMHIHAGNFQSACKELAKATGLPAQGRPFGSVDVLQITSENPKLRADAYIDTLGGMCGVMLAHNIFVAGEGALASLFKALDWLAEYGFYSRIMLSHSNHLVLDEAKKAGFQVVSKFHNRRSGNRVEILMKDVSR